MVNPVLDGLYSELSALVQRGRTIQEADDLFLDQGARMFRKAFGTQGIRYGVRFVPAEAGKYTRTLLKGGQEDLPAILAMEWRGDAPPHRHADRACMDILLSGEMEVTDYREERVEGDLYRLTPMQITHAYPGDMVKVDPRQGNVHSVRLLSDVAQTFHIYPLRATQGEFFELQPSGLYLKKNSPLVAHKP